MKRCPVCRSISSDNAEVCGVCGRSLSNVPTEALEQIELDKKADLLADRTAEATKNQKRARRRYEFIAGMLVEVFGFVMMFASFYNELIFTLGLVILIVGAALISDARGYIQIRSEKIPLRDPED